MKRIIVSLTVLALLFITAPGFAEEAARINFQGKLTNVPGNAPVNRNDVVITFSIYDLDAGGTLQYQEVHNYSVPQKLDRVLRWINWT